MRRKKATVEILPDEDAGLRRLAAHHLAKQLSTAGDLLSRSGALAAQPKGDRIKPLIAGARLIAANAQLARALGFLAQVESRHRSFVETIQQPALKKPKLNSRFSQTRIEDMTPLEQAKEQEKFYRRLDEIVEDAIRARSGEADKSDIVARNLKLAEKEVARAKRAEEGLEDVDEIDDEEQP